MQLESAKDDDYLENIKARLETNYNKLKRLIKTTIDSLHIESQIEGEIIQSALMVNNVNLMCLTVETMLKDLDALEKLVNEKVNHKLVHLNYNDLKGQVLGLSAKVADCIKLINRENII